MDGPRSLSSRPVWGKRGGAAALNDQSELPLAYLGHRAHYRPATGHGDTPRLVEIALVEFGLHREGDHAGLDAHAVVRQGVFAARLELALSLKHLGPALEQTGVGALHRRFCEL